MENAGPAGWFLVACLFLHSDLTWRAPFRPPGTSALGGTHPSSRIARNGATGRARWASPQGVSANVSEARQCAHSGYRGHFAPDRNLSFGLICPISLQSSWGRLILRARSLLLRPSILLTRGIEVNSLLTDPCLSGSYVPLVFDSPWASPPGVHPSESAQAYICTSPASCSQFRGYKLLVGIYLDDPRISLFLTRVQPHGTRLECLG